MSQVDHGCHFSPPPLIRGQLIVPIRRLGIEDFWFEFSEAEVGFSNSTDNACWLEIRKYFTFGFIYLESLRESGLF